MTDRAFGNRKYLRVRRKPMAMAATHPSQAAADIGARHLVATPCQAARSIAVWDAYADERAPIWTRRRGYAETVLRLALRAQSPSRATLETLGVLLQPPPTAFVRQGDGSTAQRVDLIAQPANAGGPRNARPNRSALAALSKQTDTLHVSWPRP